MTDAYKKLELSNDVWFESSIYDEVDVTLTYISYSTDYWSTDSEIDLYINKDKAIEIVKFLSEKYDL